MGAYEEFINFPKRIKELERRIAEWNAEMIVRAIRGDEYMEHYQDFPLNHEDARLVLNDMERKREEALLKIRAAEDETAPHEFLLKMAMEDNRVYRMCVAGNPSATEVILDMLAYDDALEVVMEVSLNPNTSEHTLERLCDHIFPPVADNASEMLRSIRSDGEYEPSLSENEFYVASKLGFLMSLRYG